MPAGLTIYNDTGTVQIDESWQNYCFKQLIPATVTVYATTPPNPPGVAGNTYQMTVSGTEALMIACRAEHLQPMMLHSYFDGSTWTFNWLFFSPSGEATETVNFYTFDVPPGGAFSNVGLEVFNASGSRVYHSDVGVMKCSAVLGCDTPFTGTPGRIYAPLIARNPVFGVFVGLPTGNRLFCHCLRGSGHTITTSVRGTGLGASGAYDNAGAYAAIDVTGLS